jgi:glycolate oxidase iron-sulfur subunit
LAESTWCCGSAGVYALTQPAQADALLHRKIANLRQTGAAVVATANPGCHLQIARGIADAGPVMDVAHPMTLLARAYRREAGLVSQISSGGTS